MMIELTCRGFAPIASILSFIAEERSAGIDLTTPEITSPANQTEYSKAGDHMSRATVLITLT
jgi:hypothetical protein